MIIPLFNAEDRAAIATAAENKRLIYLDSNIWIGLTEKESFRNAANQCRHAVHAGKVLFPVSNAAVTEVFDQPTPTQRLKVAAFMDELSRGICFFDIETIHVHEANHALDVLQGHAAATFKRNGILSWVGEYLGPTNIEFDSEFISHHNQTDAEKVTRLFAQSPAYRSVQWLAQHLPVDDMRSHHERFKKRYVDQMSAQIAQDAARVQLLDKSMRRRQILSDLRRRAIAKAFQFTGNLDEHQVKRIMAAMPSVDLSNQIFADWLIDSTTPMEKQDFLDFEHAIVGAVYADNFVTSDKYLFDLVKRCTVPKERGCNVIQGIHALVDLLQSV
jgi:hypothetical protein